MILVENTSEVLHMPSINVEVFDTSLQTFVNDLCVFMYEQGGVGIAAPQVGDPRSIAIVDHTFGQRTDSLLVLINPEIVFVDPQEDTELEGCLSYPDVIVPIKRWRGSTVTYSSTDGQRLSLNAVGLQARIIQHEVDHLRGKTFLDDIGPLTKRTLKKAKK